MPTNSEGHTGNPYSLAGITLSRFQESFGKPDMAEGSEAHWSLPTSPFGVHLHVLLIGTEHVPVVWIFDSNDRNDGASRSVIQQEEAILEIIAHIRARVNKASGLSRRRKDIDSE